MSACFIDGLVHAAGVKPTEPYHVAVSVYNTAPAFMREWTTDVQQHPAVLDDRVKLHIYNCTGSHSAQHMHFESISVRRFDAVIVVANDLNASKRLVDLLREDNIPVVASCAQTEAEGLEAFIGPDDIKAGYLTALAVAEKMGGSGKVLILRGPHEQGATQHRNAGIAQALEGYPGITELRSVPADWSRAAAIQIIQDMIGRSIAIDGIIAQNDEMALGAIDAFKMLNLPVPPIASIDGLPDAIAAVHDGDLLQTLRQDSALQAQGAVDLVLRELIGPEYLPESTAWTGGLLQQWNGKSSRFVVPWVVVTNDMATRRMASAR